MTQSTDFPILRSIGLFFLGVGAAWVVSLFAPTGHAQVFADVLELLGGGTVALGLLKIRSLFDPWPIRIGAAILDEIKRIGASIRAKTLALFRRKKPAPFPVQAVFGEGTISASGDMRATGVANETTDQRLRRIENSITELWAANSRVEQEARKANAETLVLLSAEVTERTRADVELSKRQRSISVGDMWLALVGLAWLVVGIVTSAVASAIP